MNVDEAAKGIFGDQGLAAIALTSMMMIKHLEGHHGVAHEEACAEVGIAPDKLDMLEVLFGDLAKETL